MRRPLATVVALLISLSLVTPGGAHHVGVFAPKDDDITKNFKGIKFASQAGRFDVALRLFDEGAVHEAMERLEKALPPRLEDDLRAAFKAKNLPGVELRLSLFLAFMTRERIKVAAGRLQEPGLDADQRREQARKLVNGAWRYYNLADFVISRQDPKASVALRTAFEDAQTYLGSATGDPVWAAGSNPARIAGAPSGAAAPGSRPVGPDDSKAAATLALMDRTLDEVVREGALIARRGGAKELLPGR
jgi:hypothetical protein